VKSLLKYVEIAVACAMSIVLPSFTLCFCSARLLHSAPLVQLLGLTALSVCGSGVIALMEFSGSQSEFTSARGIAPAASGVNTPLFASKNTHPDSAATTVAASLRKMPTSRSLCALVTSPRNRSKAQPPAIHHGEQMADNKTTAC
jgi:hypothetical protein